MNCAGGIPLVSRLLILFQRLCVILWHTIALTVDEGEIELGARVAVRRQWQKDTQCHLMIAARVGCGRVLVQPSRRRSGNAEQQDKDH